MICTKCKKEKGNNFPLNGTKNRGKEGLKQTHSWCRDCHKFKMVAKRAERRKLLDLLKTKPCADCQKSYPPYVMDFDHLPGTEKRFAIGQDCTKSIKDIVDEAYKCELVCSNCHRIRTHMRRTLVKTI